MNCPLKKAAAIASPSKTNSFDHTCDEGDCAWWDETNKLCAIHLEGVARNLANLVNKMPKDLAPR